MSLEAVLQQPNAVEKAACKVGQATGRALEVLVNTGINAAYAANPLRDAKQFCSSLYHLVKDKKSWKEYKANLKEGKILGKGNLRNVLFTTGILASGMYLPLLGLRAGIGAASYLGKRLLTKDYVKDKISGFLDKHKTKFSKLGKAFLRIPRHKTENYLNKWNIKNEINKLKDDKYYREKALPSIMDAAIAAKGYAGIVGSKWLAGALEKTSNSIAKNTESGLVRRMAKAGAKIGNFSKNILGDALSGLVFCAGAGHMYENGTIDKTLNGEYYKDLKEKYNYAVNGDLVKDVKSYFSTGKYAADVCTAVSGTAESIANYVSAKLQSAKQTAEQAIQDPIAAVINPEDKYAVIIAGYDIEHGDDGSCCERFVAEQCKVYKDLLDMGYRPENIKVLMPEGLDPVHPDSHFPEGFQELKKAYADTSYDHDATEANLEQVLKEMGTKVDSNDTFVFYLGSHGNRGWDFQDSDYKTHSYVGLNNGSEVMYDHELTDYVKPIQGEKEFYFIDACHSSGFAEEGGRQDGIWVAACTKDQPALMHENGDSFASQLVEELKQNGGINNNTTYEQVKSCAKKTIDEFKKSWNNYKYVNPLVWIYANEQTPVMVDNQQKPDYLKNQAYSFAT